VVRREALQNRTEDLMTKAAKKRSPARSTSPAPAAKPGQQSINGPMTGNDNPGSKQSRVIAMLQSPTGQRLQP